MLSEAIRRKSRGEDVAIGVVETHGRKGIEELVAQIPSVPRLKLEYKGTLFEEMDLDAILARRPQVVLVDELAHTNIDVYKRQAKERGIGVEELRATVARHSMGREFGVLGEPRVNVLELNLELDAHSEVKKP